ncbi:Ulp1 protease family, carboxy-terminal domain protein [Medicago truncatula]|uniref:Ulp1 protease family, carboxy-terminal domain protein n=3 Tax=Medicago truncatula TaxID=3880 RepID=A0A072THD0_MEDTR|nr:Ulp1 protease family, carboxy-terminal domain protein [Medicago truncatula]
MEVSIERAFSLLLWSIRRGRRRCLCFPSITIICMCINCALHSKSKSKSSIIPWMKIKCPMQTNGIDCGYFVMQFMKEIILANQDMIPENYFGDYKCKTYSKDKLVQVEEDWATFMVQYLRDYIADRLKP